MSEISKAEPGSPEPQLFNTLLEVTFGGLCSFVETVDRVHVLAVAAENSSVMPRLCRHTTILQFAATDLVSVEGEPFYTSFSNAQGEVICVWDIGGCVFQILPQGVTGPEDNPFGLPAISLDPSYDQVLDLRPYGNGVESSWLAAEPRNGSLIHARFELLWGELSCPKVTDKPWQMVLPDQPVSSAGAYLGQTVHYALPGPPDLKYVDLHAVDYRAGTERKIRLEKGSKIGVSNLCAFENVQSTEEKDVLAYYELCRVPPQMHERLIPKLGIDHNVPGQSACPPGRQSDP